MERTDLFAISRIVCFILILMNASRGMSNSIQCVIESARLDNRQECLGSSNGFSVLGMVSRATLVGTLGATLSAQDQYASGNLRLAWLPSWTEGAPLKQRATSPISDILRTLLRMFLLPEGPRRASLHRRQ